MNRLLLALFALFLVSGCMGPVTKRPHGSYSDIKTEVRQETGDILENYVNARQRILAIGMPILIRNARLCPRRALTPGFSVYSDFDLPDRLRDEASTRLDVGSEGTVLSVFPGTQAWSDGLRPGARIVTIDNKTVRNAAEIRARLRKIQKNGHADFGFMQNGYALSMNLPFVPVCNYKFEYAMISDDADNALVNAYADGKTIVIPQGMYDFTSDDELANVIGHELAHNIMHHKAKRQVNTAGIEIVSIVVDGVFGTNVEDYLLKIYTNLYSPAFEAEADYVGLYLVARAGGNIEAAAPFWRKMAAHYGIDNVVERTDMIKTHPITPERVTMLKNTLAEIENKKRTHKILMPEMDGQWNFGARFAWWSDTDETDDQPTDEDLNH